MGLETPSHQIFIFLKVWWTTQMFDFPNWVVGLPYGVECSVDRPAIAFVRHRRCHISRRICATTLNFVPSIFWLSQDQLLLSLSSSPSSFANVRPRYPKARTRYVRLVNGHCIDPYVESFLHIRFDLVQSGSTRTWRFFPQLPPHPSILDF